MRRFSILTSLQTTLSEIASKSWNHVRDIGKLRMIVPRPSPARAICIAFCVYALGVILFLPSSVSGAAQDSNSTNAEHGRAAAGANDPSPMVDKLFASFEKPGSPGCAIGVIRDGNFVLRKAYGLASLELEVPLSPQSVFYMGSVSKQFTAASVVLAAEQGFLSLDDDVRRYIPELPDYGHPITLRQILHQTSGFRDFFDLIYFSGRNAADFNDPDEIFKLVMRQTGLNNVPGAEYLYSNTNYFLLGMVVQRATKKTLAQFAEQNIFQPLGMTHTRFYDDATVVAPGRVAAYDADKNGNFLVDWSTRYRVVGGGGLMSTIDDLLLWDRNFYANRLGKGTLVKELETRGVLNSGKPINYALGLFWATYRGLRVVGHDGALFGYRTQILRFPEQKFSVLCLCNLSNANPGNLARKVADVYLAKELQRADRMSGPSGNNYSPDAAVFAGKYLDPRNHQLYTFTASDGNLEAWGSVLRRRSANEFYDLLGNVIMFEGANGSMKAMLDMEGTTYFAGSKVLEMHLNEESLTALTGQYRSSELDAACIVSLEQGSLMLRIGSNPPMKLAPIAKDEFDAADSFAVVFDRSKDDRISGLTLFADAARGIHFTRAN
jgi:CubicO group peptidase (beta-lactamase class C family)